MNDERINLTDEQRNIIASNIYLYFIHPYGAVNVHAMMADKLEVTEEIAKEMVNRFVHTSRSIGSMLWIRHNDTKCNLAVRKIAEMTGERPYDVHSSLNRETYSRLGIRRSPEPNNPC